MQDVRLEVVGSIHQVPAEAWDACAGDDNPFVEHAFLRVLEDAGCLGPESGWSPHYLLVRGGEGARIDGIAPVYAKTDSYGEYIFDWGWAQGAQRAGLPYYPKLTVAVPFTPATGPRLLLHPGAPREATLDALVGGTLVLADRMGATGVHWLFCEAAEAEALASRRFLHRNTFQFHWNNAGYSTFEDFLAHLTRRRRKEVRRERRKASEHGLDIVLKEGDQMTPGDWDGLWHFYSSTHAARPWQRQYLTREWFDQARSELRHSVVAVLAYHQGVPVAGSLSFRKGDKLFGRYWGAVAELDALHFECCYYRLVEYAIDTGVQLFEAGAQGGHKLRRGFLPQLTHSAHHLVHPGLHQAIARFIEQETASTLAEMDALGDAGPFEDRQMSGDT
jgi:predicted N-acyltransferase